MRLKNLLRAKRNGKYNMPSSSVDELRLDLSYRIRPKGNAREIQGRESPPDGTTSEAKVVHKMSQS